MTRARAPYMEWAKARPRPEIDLAGSNLLPCSLDDLPGACEALDIAGESPDGYPPLLEAIARTCGVDTNRIATAGGCSGANFLVCAALLDTDHEVLVETPGYDPLPGAARMLGARIATFPRRFEDGYDVDAGAVAAAITPRTRLVMISNPHNPSGALAREESLRSLGRLAEQHGFHVLVDEVYRDTVLDARPAAAATLSPLFVSTSSLTKAYGLASLRCGWSLSSPELARRVRRARDLVDVWAPMPADRLSVVAFRHLGPLAARARAIVTENLGRVARWLESRPELESVSPRSTLAFPRLSGIADAGPWVDRLFAETGTAVAPGRFFGAPSHFRIAFGGRPDAVASGLEAIDRLLQSASLRPARLDKRKPPSYGSFLAPGEGAEKGGFMPEETRQGGQTDFTQWHEVKSGETLSKIAQRYYGDASLYPKIFEANKDVLKDPNLIRVGQKLRIP